LGSTNDLERRLQEYKAGKTHSTRRLRREIELITSRECASLDETRAWERQLKSWENHRKVVAYFCH